MKNTYWYLGLAVIGLLLLTFTLWKKKDIRLLVLLFCLDGISHPFETTVLLLHPGYRIMPGISGNKLLDGAQGAFISDFFIISSAAVMVAAFNLKPVWMLLTASFIMGIEWLFLSLGIYEHYWWKTIYTGIGLMTFLYIGKKIWSAIRDNYLNRYVLLLILYFSFLVVHNILTFTSAASFHKFHFEAGWFPDPTMDHLIFGAVYLYIISIIAAVLVWARINWSFRIMGLVAMYALDFLLFKKGILRFDSNWNILHLMAIHISAISILMLFQWVLVRRRTIV